MAPRFNISKGDRFNIAKSEGLEKIKAVLRWEGDCDLDASVFLCNDEGQIVNDEAFVFYNSENRSEAFDRNVHRNKNNWRKVTRPMSADGAVLGSFDSLEGGVETIDIDLNKVDPEVSEIVIVATIHGDDDTMGNAQNARISVINADNDEELCEYALNEQFTSETAVEIARLTINEDGDWTFEPIGIGHEGGIQTLIDIYAS